jgi:GDP-4-dehydro-6-deoxy-D-mannose reductase
MDIVRVRPFNYIGPGQSDRFVASSFARQIAQIEAGLRNATIAVGNLEAQRDFTDVRDMVAAFELALRDGVTGSVYNVGTGTAVPIRTLLDVLVSHCRIHVDIQVDPGRLRQSDPPVSICDATCFRERTGWEPRVPLETTLEDTLRFWRDRVSGA